MKAKREGFEADDGDSEIVHHEVGETAGDRYVDLIAAVGKVILMVGMMMGVKSILFSAATMLKPWRVTTPASMLMGICIGMSTPKVRAISGIASAACKPMRP